DSSDDEYSSVDVEDLENVDFYITGEEDVIIKNLTTHNDFLNRLCSTGGLFRGGVPKQDFSLPNIPEDDPDGSTIEPQFKVKRGIVYLVFNPDIPWNQFLGGSKVGLKKKVGKNKKVTFKEKKDNESGVGSSKPPVCSPHSSLGKQWTKKAIKKDNKPCYPFREIKKAKQTALYDHKGGLIDHYGKLWEYRQALIDLNPDWLPQVKHRKCTRHLYCNFKKRFSGVQFKRNPNSWPRAFFKMDRTCAAFENACASKGGGRGSRGGRMGRGNETMNVNDDAKAGVGRWTTVGRSRGRDRRGGGRGRGRKGTGVFLKTPTAGYSGGPLTYEQDMQVDDATTSSTKKNRKRPMTTDMQADESTSKQAEEGQGTTTSFQDLYEKQG
nr:F-box domain, leucine-rich repeat domain, L domain-like protein [Tanacetum cinerariifolium]